MGPRHRVVGVMQARMASTRLPGKALADLEGRPVLAWAIEGGRRARALDDLAVATTSAPEDEAIIACAQACDTAAFVGHPHDVLDRVARAAALLAAAVVVRLTADCPFLDPAIVDAVVARHFEAAADLTTNDVACGGHPRGFDVEAINVQALERARRDATASHHREHVTPFLFEHPAEFRIAVVRAAPALRRPGYRLCVDTAEDLALCREIAARLGPSRPDAAAIIALLDGEPALAAMNGGVEQKPVEAGGG